MKSMTTRDRILVALTGPRCPRELAEGLALHVRAVQTAIRRLTEDNLLECITPEMTQARLYSLTGLGRTKRYDLTRESIEDDPDIDWDLYAYIQSGSYRRRILAALTMPSTVRHLRKLLNVQGCGMQESHIHNTLSDLSKVGVTIKDHQQGWMTTPAGSTMREYLLKLSANQTANGPGHRCGGDQVAGRSGPAA